MIELTREGGEKILLRPTAIILIAPAYPDAPREACKTAVTFEVGQACIVEYVQESVSAIQGRL